MLSPLSWYTVRLKLGGIPKDQASEESVALQDELSMRPHLKNPQVSWEAEGGQIVLEVGIEGLSPESAARQMAEELLEVASGVVLLDHSISVEILGVYSDSF